MWGSDTVCPPRMVHWVCHCVRATLGFSVDFILQEVFLQERVLEGSGMVVSLLSHLISISSCSWSPSEQLMFLLAALDFWHISN